MHAFLKKIDDTKYETDVYNCFRLKRKPSAILPAAFSMGSHPKSAQNPLQTSIIYAIIEGYIRQNAGHGNPVNRIRINRKEVFSLWTQVHFRFHSPIT
ncbi:hypothetical protein RUMCAL_03268 [Ruminococcus callidus ATCC 27760]|uniref:Uncharacterized protein n=2 Tax=Ruminococcus callidus TaxID=40519 RepID=U2JN09_9FIRM|nr:hypothetical protein RUMCAL_03268 [Ruminococcus callidus ATCC 27760]